MALPGKSVNWISGQFSKGRSKLVGGALLGIGATAGVIGGLTDKDGPWRNEIIPGVQETLSGDPNALQNLASAAISTEISGYDEDVYRPAQYYYGEYFNAKPRANQRTNNPVQGDVVFGMYNLRR